MLEFLRKEGISEKLICEIEKFRKFYKVKGELKYRIPNPRYNYYGNDVWEEAVTALLCGENLLLVGSKATGKNVLSENLAAAFGRPSWDVSFHVNTDSSSLIGTDTFENGQVVLRHGPIYECAKWGGFGILDEINMAKNDSIAVLHATLDYRKIIDVPGYDKIKVDEAGRFIATMNYGYAGTRELNEALTSRFMVINMPGISTNNLEKMLLKEFPNINSKYLEQFAAMFNDLRIKSENSEISTKSVDLRGLISSINLMDKGLEANKALEMGITNKSFDDFERELVVDVIRLRIPRNLERSEIFTD
ncbi:MAG: MoxR family ATPase [Sedimentibacter sp.]|uniref:MoxR family ATPase n=1 Tax=Sedimentibacter sp. TaxID=1960295 RepID=UPI0029820B2F|nr:MoxR family ATPase [Sedimentibacter sp.]MDW5298542.1 MoxR family ATPase [Sedimentibacter sp.]